MNNFHETNCFVSFPGNKGNNRWKLLLLKSLNHITLKIMTLRSIPGNQVHKQGIPVWASSFTYDLEDTEAT